MCTYCTSNRHKVSTQWEWASLCALFYLSILSKEDKGYRVNPLYEIQNLLVSYIPQSIFSEYPLFFGNFIHVYNVS